MGFLSASRSNETIYSLPAAVATGAGTSLQVLGYAPIPANAFRRAGQAIRCTAWGHGAANTNSKTISLVIGPAALVSAGATAPTQAQKNTGAAASGTVALLSTTATSTSADSAFAKAYIQYTSTSVQTALAESGLNSAAKAPKVTSLTQDASTALALYFCCTDGTDSASDFTLDGMVVEGLSD